MKELLTTLRFEPAADTPFGEEVPAASNSAATCARHDVHSVHLGLSIGSMIPDISTYLSAEDPI